MNIQDQNRLLDPTSTTTTTTTTLSRFSINFNKPTKLKTLTNRTTIQSPTTISLSPPVNMIHNNHSSISHLNQPPTTNTSPDTSTIILKPHRHSFWSGLGLKNRSNSRKNSSVTLAAYPNQQIYNTPTTPHPTLQLPSLIGPSRVIAVVGNIRRGIGRMILEELVLQKFIVVALIDKADGEFSRSVENLANSPSLFHAFVVEGGLFGQAMASESDQFNPKLNHQLITHHQPLTSTINNHTNRSKAFRSFRLGSKKTIATTPSSSSSSSSKNPTPLSSATGSLGDSSITTTTEPSSLQSFISNQPTSALQTARLRSIVELKNIFQAYRVDTVICSFEPQVLDQPLGPRSKARVQDEKQFGLPPAAERARIERMERTVLEASLASTAVGRFAVTIHPSSLGPSVLSPNPTHSIRSHLLSVLTQQPRLNQEPPITITEFRWGFLMNDLAFDDSLVDGATAENGLGKWLCEPPKSRCVIDYERRRCLIPARTTSRKKGKHKLEPVCMTLAEDVSRFIGLACRLRDHWEWKTGKMVGDCVLGGWEEMVETIEKISKKKLDRQYVCVGSMVNGYASDSGSSNSSLEQQKPISSNFDLVDSSSGVIQNRLSTEEVYRFEDELRANLAKENQDASSVRLREFVRVWYTPLPQPPSIVIDGNRLRKKSLRGNLRHIPLTNSLGGPSKPQVAENGTLRELGLRPNNDPKKKPIDGPAPNQFLSVPTATSAVTPSIGQALSTNSQPRSPASSSLPSRAPISSPGDHPQDFNFIPKIIAPFNNPIPNHPTQAPSNTFQQAYQPPIQSNHLNPAGPFFHPSPPPPASSTTDFSFSHPSIAHLTGPPTPSSSSNSNGGHHDGTHRILPRSPLAARVA